MRAARHWLGAALVAAAACAHGADACPPEAAMPTPEQVQQGLKAARDRGFLWRISKDGRSSYLYGTLHVGKLEWAFPGRTVAQALRAADTLALELDLTDPALVQEAAAFGAQAPALPSALRARLVRQAAAACVDADAIGTLHPVMQAVTLAMLAGRRDGLDPAFAQELVLAGAARALQRPVVALETLRDQLAALVPDDPAQAITLVEQTLEQLEQGRVRPVLARMSRAWERSDLDELEDYERWCECAVTPDERAFLRRVNDARNPALAARIDALHGAGRRVFAAVGALHMTGEQALPALMAARGYVVERVLFDR